MANYNIDAIYNGSTSLPGTERIRIDGAGNVGINQSSPAYKLDVNGTARIANDMLATGNITIGKAAAYLILDGTNSDAEIYWRANSSNRWAAGMNVGDATENFNIYNYTTATTNLTILKANGNVGIGSTAPAYKLDVNGSIGVVGLRFVDQSTSYFRIFEPAGNIAIYLGNAADPANYYDNSTHFFRNRGGSSTYAVIEGNGNLGIGTTSVTAPLHIYRASNPWIRLNGGGNYSYIRFDDGTSNGYLFKNTSSDTSNGALAGAMYTYTDSGKAFQHIHSGTPLFTILSGGNVGIGTTSPSAKLHVVGNADIGDSTADTGIIVRHGAGSAQYGRIRFYDSGGNNIHTIHSFPTAWQGGTFLNSSAGALNLTGYNGVTFGAWNSVDVAFAANGNNYFKGNVGIGVTTAATKFVVSADATDSDVGQLRVIGSTSTAKMINVGYHTTNNYGFISSLIAGSGYSALSLQPNGGNVGIATVSPDVRLHVINGTTKLNKNNYKTTTAYSTADLVLGDDVSSRTGYAGNGSNLVLHANGTTSITFLDQTRNLGEITYSNKLFTIGGDIGWGTASVLFPGTVNFGANIYHSIGGQKFFAGSGGNYAYLYTGGVALNFLNSTDTSTLMTVLNDGNVGIGTTSPNKKLQVIGSLGKGYNLYEVPIALLAASATQAKRYEIARVFIDYNDWNSTGPVEIEVRESYYSDGRYKRYVFSYGYNSSNVGSLWLVEDTGRGANDFKAEVGSAVLISGDIYYVPIYIDVDYYQYVDVLVRTNRTRTTNASSPSGGVIYINESPTGTNISSFGPDEVTYISLASSKTYLGYSGNVGIGTSSPTNKLHIYSSANEPVLIQGTTGGTWLNFQSSTSNLLSIGADSTRGIGFYNRTTSADLMTISNGGNVGIGTNIPVTKLHVEQVQNAESLITLRNNRQDLADVPIFGISAQNSVTDVAKISFYRGGGGNSGYLTFSTKFDNAASLTEKVRIDGAGNVGIGTTSPSSTKLHVVADWVSGHSTIKVQGITDNTTGYGFYNTSGARMGYVAYVGSAFEWYNNEAIPIIFYTSGLERMRVLSGGNVGIGTTVSAEKLSVEGSIILAASDGTSLGSGRKLRFYRPSDGWEPAQIEQIWTGGGYQGVLAFKTNTGALGTLTTKMVINNDGNVGIGTTSPRVLLDLAKANNVGQVILIGETSTNIRTGFGLDSSTAGMRIFCPNLNSEAIYIGGISTSDGTTFTRNHSFGVGGKNSWLNEQGGNVGIGTTSPGNKLHVWTGTVQVSGFQSIAAGPLTFLRSDYNGSGAVQINFLNINPSNGYDSDLGIQLMNTGGSMTDVLRIKGSNGNVGIGTTAPNDKLDVVGRVYAYRYIAVSSNASSPAYATDTSTGMYNAATNQIGFSISGTEKLRIDSNGNVGIGTSNPISLLQIAGTTSIFPTYDSITGYSYFLRMGYDTSGSYDYTIKRNGTTGFLEFNGTQGSPYVSYVFAGGDVYSGASGGTVGGFYFNSSSHGIRRATGTNDVYCFTTSGTLYLGAGGSSTTHVRVLSGGDVGIGVSPSYKLDVNGNIHGTGFPTSSDVRFKKNITPLQNSLEKIKKLQGVKYEWNEFVNSRRDGYKLNIPIIGLIAQDVEQVVPEIVDHWKLSDDCQDARSIDYPRLIPLLIEAIKEQQNQIEELRNEIKSLKSN